jgi:hypothetical protein
MSLSPVPAYTSVAKARSGWAAISLLRQALPYGMPSYLAYEILLDKVAEYMYFETKDKQSSFLCYGITCLKNVFKGLSIDKSINFNLIYKHSKEYIDPVQVFLQTVR